MEEFTTIRTILESERENNKGFVNYLMTKLNESGYKITERQIYRYLSGDVVPKYQTAKAILKILKYNISAEAISELLKNSEIEKENNFDTSLTNTYALPKEDINALHKRLTIKNSDFTFLDDTDIDNSHCLELINQKVAENYGDDELAFRRYIIDLIDNDMKK